MMASLVPVAGDEEFWPGAEVERAALLVDGRGVPDHRAARAPHLHAVAIDRGLRGVRRGVEAPGGLAGDCVERLDAAVRAAALVRRQSGGGHLERRQRHVKSVGVKADRSADDRGREPLHALAPAQPAGGRVHGVHHGHLVGEEQRGDAVGGLVQGERGVDRRLRRERPAHAAAAAIQREQVRALAAQEHGVARDDRLRAHGIDRRQRDRPLQLESVDVPAVDDDAVGLPQVAAAEAPVLAAGHQHGRLARTGAGGDPGVALRVLLGREPLRQAHPLFRPEGRRLRLHLAEFHRHQDLGGRQPAQRVRGRCLGFRHLVTDGAGGLVERRHVVGYRGAGVRRTGPRE